MFITNLVNGCKHVIHIDNSVCLLALQFLYAL